MTGTESSAEVDEFEEGRYLYCAIRAEDASPLSVEGIEGGSVSIITRDGIGAVVQPVGSLFDSDDLMQVQRWLLSHQRVVDAASDAFGTPVPFRFDTIIKGDDDRVRAWIDEHATALADALDTLSGRWEYRVELRWNETAAREGIAADDEELSELESRIDEASEGTGYLLEKQYEQRIDDRLQDRRADLTETLYDRVADHADAIETLDRQTTLLDAEGEDGDDEALEPVVRLSVLAREDDEGAIGDVLEAFAGQPAFEVRYTGPWPPYSHAPTIESGGGE